MACMFYAASTFDGDLSKWYVARVTDMKCTFYGASAFNGDLSKWYVAKVTDMACMFPGASDFNVTPALRPRTANTKTK